VLDASVGIKLFIDEAGAEQANHIFQRLAASPPANLYVPDLFFAECANVLWKYVRQYRYAAEAARQNLIDLQALALQAVPTSSLVDRALSLALEYDVTVYDACYLALAQLAGVPLVTADSALVNKMRGAEVEVRALSENAPSER
jgi:predicted nucleic acid-binding protein